jgi:hypothetical protein
LKNVQDFAKMLFLLPTVAVDAWSISKHELVPLGIGHKAIMIGLEIGHVVKPVLWLWHEPRSRLKHKWHPVMFAVKKSWYVRTNEI